MSQHPAAAIGDRLHLTRMALPLSQIVFCTKGRPYRNGLQSSGKWPRTTIN
jgi:hypothetical protein